MCVLEVICSNGSIIVSYYILNYVMCSLSFFKKLLIRTFTELTVGNTKGPSRAGAL